MTQALARYLELRARLAQVRWKHAGYDSADEELLLEEMDDAWEALSEAEIAELEAHPPPAPLLRSGPMPPGHVLCKDEDVLGCPSSPPRKLRETG